MHIDDNSRLRHMLDAAQQAIRFARGKNRQALERDEMLTFAILRALEIVGEAASQVSKKFQVAHPEIPWPQIIGMRNHLVHAYFDVDVERVWDTVTDDLPPLITALKQIVRK